MNRWAASRGSLRVIPLLAQSGATPPQWNDREWLDANRDATPSR